VYLDPAPAVFEAMLEGWATQQRSRFLSESTIASRLRMMRRLAEFSGLYPWQWNPAEGEAFISHLRSGPKPVAVSTARGYEVSVRLFCEYLLDARYGWAEECVKRFGEAPQQVFHEDNSVLHVDGYEGEPGRRPLAYDEVQAVFDAADALADAIRARGRKGALRALRDAAVLKLTYAFGLRRREVTLLDLVDLRANPKIPEFGRCGMVMVRYGKASPGGAPKRRTVLLVPEMDWVVPVLEHGSARSVRR
jgi:integrase